MGFTNPYINIIPPRIQFPLAYKGAWDASTNTPTLVSSVGTKGDFYIVSVAGNTNLNGITSWNIGDWAVFNGSAWEKVDNSQNIVTVTAPLALNSGVLSIPLATSLANGYLSASDWTTFNNKQIGLNILSVGVTPNSAGMSLVGPNFNLEAATVSFPGVVTETAQTFGGIKTFNVSPIITPFNTVGIVHNNALGALSTSLIVNADISPSANIDLSKINTSGLGKGYGASISGNISLTNPCASFFHLINTTGIVTLPAMNEADSLSAIQNSRIIFKNVASGDYTINDKNNDFLLTIPPGKTYEFIPQSNSVNLPGGQWVWIDLSFIYSYTPPIDVTNGVISMPQASSLQDGYLDSNDWVTFNNKQASGNYITALTGDVTATGPNSVAATIANNAVTAGKIATNAVTNSKLDLVAPNTLKGSISGAPASPTDLSVTQVLAMLLLNIASGRIPYGNVGGTGLTSESDFIWDSTNNFLGVGVAVPHAPIHLINAAANRKIVLYETTNNDHQFYGFGVNGSVLRYQGDSTSTDHVFYAATSSTTSDELFRIKGNKIIQTLAGGGIQFGNSTASYTPSTLDYYEEGSFTVNFTGATTISSKTVNFIRIGKTVVLYFSSSTAAASSAASITSGSAAIPARLRPASGFDCDGQTWVMDSSAWQSTPGRAIALNDGTIQIYKANVTTNFTNSGNCGFGNTYLRYMCA